MAIIYSYPLNTPKRDDLLIGTVTYDENAQDPVVGNPTVSFTVGSLLDLVASQGAAQNLQQVTNIGNTTTNSIVISNSLKVAGGYYDSSNQPGTSGQILSSTATGTQWVNVAAQGVTSVGLSMPAAFTVANSPITQSGTLTVTGAGTAAQYINGLGNLVTFPTIPTPYVLPVATTVALGGIKIGYIQNAKNYPVVLSNQQAYVNVPWTDTPYVLPLAASGTRGGVQIGYTENAKNYPVELDNEKMFVNVPWTDTPYVLPVATASDLGGVKIGYTENAKNYPVELASDKMFVNVPWTDTQTVQTITGTGSDNTDSGVLLSNSGGTVLILGAGSVAASQTGNTITLTGTDTGVTGVTLATGTSTGAPLSESITNRELTLTSFEYDGGSNIGYVPAGGTSTTYLKGDGSWAAIPTGLQFKGTWDASGGGGGNPDLTQGANKGAGFLWICDDAGTAYPNGGSNPPSTWALGDWCIYDGSAWTRVPATNAGVTSFKADSTNSTYLTMTPTTAITGAIELDADLSAQDGTSDTSTRFLSKDNTWDVPSYTTDTNTQNIYTNSWQQSTNDIILRKVLSGAGSGTQDIKIVKGANITFTYTDANNFTIAATDTTYTAGTGLTLNGTVFSADINATQATSATSSLSSTANRYYAVQLDNNNTVADANLVVNVPWVDTDTTYNAMTTAVLGLGKIRYNIGTTPAAEAQSVTANRTYGVTKNSSDQLVVNVPWISGGTYNWTVKDNASNPGSSSVTSGDSIKFVTATGPLGTALTDPNSDGNFIMTLTSPDTTTNTTYDLAGAADGSVAANYNLVLSADGTAQDTMVFKQGSNVTFTRAADSLTIAADNDNTTYDFLAVQTGGDNNNPNLRLDPSTGNPDNVTLTGGSNMTITRDSDTEITFDATNTWNANTKTVAGYVAAPGAVASKVWKTDASGNPAWRDDATGDNNTYSLSSGNTKVITLTDTSTSTAAGTVTFADGNDISISGSNGTITIASTFAEADTLATVTGRGDTTTTKSYFNGDLEVKNEITVVKTNVSTPGKITINGNTDATLQLKSEDTALAANETLGVIEFYGSDGTAPGAGVKSSIRARNGAQTGGVGDTSNLIFAVSDGTSNNNEALRINPTGSIAIDGATKYGTSGQILTSAGDAPPTWETFNGVTGSGTTNTVPRWTSSSNLGDGPLTFSQNSTATWASADTVMGGRLEVGSEGTNSVGSRIAIGAPTGNSSYLYFASTVSSIPANTRQYVMGIDALSSDRSFKFNIQGAAPNQGNNIIKINYTGEIDFNTIPPVGGGNQTTSLRIDNNGNVAIQPGGSTLTNTRLNIVSADHYDPSLYDGMGGIRIGTAASGVVDGNYTGGIGFAVASGTSGIAGVQKGTDGDKQGLAFFTHPSTTGGDAAEEKMRLDADGNLGIGTESPSGPFHVKVGTSTPLIVSSSSYCNNVGIRTTTPTASLQVKGNISYSYVDYTNVANTWMNVISMAGYPTGLYQISIIKKTNASTYISAIIKWDDSGSGSGSIVGTVTSNQLSVSFNNTTTLQAISGVSTGTAMSANLKCLVMNEDSCS